MAPIRRLSSLFWFSLIITALLLAGLGWPLASLRAESSITLQLNPSTLTLAPGETATVTIEVEAGSSSVDGVAAFLNFDPSRVVLQSLQVDPAFPVVLLNTIDPVEGTVDLVVGALNAPFPSGTFAVATFEVRALNVEGTTTLTFDRGETDLLRQSDLTWAGASILEVTRDLTLEIAEAPPPTATPTAPPTATPTAPPTATPTAPPTATPTAP
uniref:cohesin domain-containing protein n=1 Tax=Candidatus Chloroploca sp. Khr17 TaxID=2496869 RepID=UPI00196ABD4A